MYTVYPMRPSEAIAAPIMSDGRDASMPMMVMTKARVARTIKIVKSRGCNGDAGSLFVAFNGSPRCCC